MKNQNRLKISRFFYATLIQISYLHKNKIKKAMKKLFLLFMLTPLLITSSCENDNDDQIVCTQEFVYGLNVIVLDATTGNPLVEGVTVEATDGGYHETLQLVPGLEYSFTGAGEIGRASCRERVYSSV